MEFRRVLFRSARVSPASVLTYSPLLGACVSVSGLSFRSPSGVSARAAFNSAPTTSPSPTMKKNRSTIMTPTSRSEEHTSELQSLMRISYAVFCLKKTKNRNTYKNIYHHHNTNIAHTVKLIKHTCK